MADTHHFHAHKLFDYTSHVALITGGGTGIGLMCAQALAANGAKVYITSRRQEALDTASKSHDPSSSKGRIIPLRTCDVTSKGDLAALVKEVGEKEKYISLLMCNAGIGGPKADPQSADSSGEDLKKTLWENESTEQWSQTFDTDVTSVYFTTVAFLPLLQASQKSRGGPFEKFVPNVITTSSMSGLMRHAQGHFSYNAAKAATVHLTKMMSAEFQKAGIRVNSIAPGYFPSEMTVKESDEKNKSSLPAEQVADKGHVPLMRGGRETEMGMTVLFIGANAYLNGVIINVDGGVLNVVGGA